MVTNIWDEIKFIRKIKGGIWYKTKHRGWIRPEIFKLYLGYSFDPILLKKENYE